MPLQYHPTPGTIVICDFKGFVLPEMVKRRPAVVVSPRFRERTDLCTIVPLSTTEPTKVMPYHHRLYLNPNLPQPYDAMIQWVKADMFATVSFQRLNLPFKRKDDGGKREYDIRIIDNVDLQKVRECMLHALGLSYLTPHI